ncbi:hypothetical protein [Streptomyces sp. NRRL F-5123]|uniref:hypothetical protein n=1 Tax=Streptomyces sp. NRRL F-5123 TaxID=1463856 RepID=UPI0006946A11|nr:hypothetical protein [Streptomyces sp. NRRL F-5123]
MNLRAKKAKLAACTVGALSAAVLAVSAAPASANTDNGCGYPQVCFYKTSSNWDARQWTAAYKDVTSYFQNLSSKAYGSFSVFNSRNDDGALLHYTNGGLRCAEPGDIVYNNSWVVDKIRIMDDPHCDGMGAW